MLGSLIGAGVSALSSLFGGSMNASAAEKAARQSQKAAAALNKKNIQAAKTLNQNKVQWLVEDARRAGIHPLAALGSSVSGSWATPTASATGSYDQGSAMGSAIADAGAAIGRGVEGALAETPGLQNDLLRSQIKQTDAQTALMLAQATSRTTAARMMNEGRGLQVTDTTMGGRKIKANPEWSDAQEIENRYGEFSDLFYGPIVAGADAYHNLKGMTPASIEAWMQRNVDPYIPYLDEQRAITGRIKSWFGY